MGNEAAQQQREPVWDGISRREIDVEFRSVNEDERSFEVVASTETLDSHGDVLKQFWNLDRYQKNPVVLWNHNIGVMWGSGDAEEGLPIGKAADVRIEGKKLVAKLFLLKGDAASEPLIDKIWRRVQQEVLRAVSVGFRAGQVTRITNPAGETLHYELGSKERPNELREISLVPMGSNPDAVAKSIAWERKHLSVDATEQRATPGEQPATAAAPAAPSTPITPVPVVVPDAPKQILTTAKEKQMDFKKFLASLGLGEDATEDAAIAAITKLKTSAKVGADVEQLVSEAGPAATGVVRALIAEREANKGLATEVAKLKVVNARRGFDAAKKLAQDERRLSPVQIKQFEDRFDKAAADTQSEDPAARAAEIAEEFTSFVKASPKGAIGGTRLLPPSPEEGDASALTYEGKKFEELKPMQQKRLKDNNPELYDSMREDAQARGAI